jgi:PadR family transcriptional regulator, regulatory protein PadR
MDATKLTTLRRGVLEFLVLAMASSRPVYTADILERLDTAGSATQEGTLYPLLSRMRRDGLLDYDWRESATGPPRKYYRATDAGRRQLEQFRTHLSEMTRLIDEFGSNHAPSD